MNPKDVIVCRCEDVTLYDVLEAIKDGIADMESLKRKLQFGTGPCQGKTCVPLVEKILARETGKRVGESGRITSRPPESPVPFGIFVSRENKNEKP